MESFLAAAQRRSSSLKMGAGDVVGGIGVSPVRCGELLCQRDSYARELTTVVVSCTPRPASTLTTAPKGKKKSGAPPPSTEQLWDVVLGDSVLFPEGGGQPSDSGTIGGVPCHRVDNVNGTATHVCSAPLDPGATVQVVVDWLRREDHMCQHSTQHLVTALALQKWGFETTSWGLGEHTSFLELATPELSPEVLSELEDAANEAIKAATPVVPSWHTVADVNEGAVAGLRKSSKPLPPSVTGPVRVITFEGIDTNTCCGTHVKATSRLQAVKFLRVERAKEACRLHYVAGARVLGVLGRAYERASALAGRMNVPQEQLLDRYEENTRKAAEQERLAKTLALEVVTLLAEALRARIVAGERTVHVHRTSADADFVKALATALDESLTEKGSLLLVTVGEGAGEGTFTLAGPAALVEAASAGVAKALEGRGGGKGGRFQGKCQRLSATDAAVAAASAALGSMAK